MSEALTTNISPMNYLKIFFRRKEMFIIPAFIGLVIGVCAGIVMPKQYTSTTTLMVEEGRRDNPLFGSLTMSTTVRQRISTIRESMLGWNSLIQLVKRLNLDKGIRSSLELENLIQGIRSRISISMRGPSIIYLSYSDKNPQSTQSVVRNISEIFIERNIEIQNQETADAIKFIEEQLKVYRGKIKSAEIAALKENLKMALRDSTEEHPRVKAFREQLKLLEEELEAENLEYTESLSLSTEQTNPIIDSIKSALDNLDGGASSITNVNNPQDEYYRIMIAEKVGQVMARDADVNNKIYNLLLQRLETAKITQRLQTSKEGTRYTVLDPPRLPIKPSKPNKLLVAMAGLGAGVVLGFCLVFMSEFLDKSFIDVEDANQFFGKPLMGAISKINTDTSIRRHRERQIWLYALIFVVGLAAIILTKAIANFMV